MVEEDPPIIHNHHRVELREGKGYSVKDTFSTSLFLAAPGKTPVTSVKRYDVIHVLDIDQNTQEVFFQIAQTDPLPGGPYGISPFGIDLGWQRGPLGVFHQYPIYRSGTSMLKSHLRAKSEPVAAVIEGLALVRPFEFTLKNGEVKIDVLAQKQFYYTLPIIRRVKLGNYHIVITYDPQWQKFPTGRNIVIEDFDGNQGLDLNFPADAKTRIFILHESTQN